jgi:hypothetical protein
VSLFAQLDAPSHLRYRFLVFRRSPKYSDQKAKYVGSRKNDLLRGFGILLNCLSNKGSIPAYSTVLFSASRQTVRIPSLTETFRKVSPHR